MFIIGMVLFGLGAFISAISTNELTLLFGWSILEGIGGAFMMPSTQALIMDIYKGKDRSIAFGIWGGVAGLAVAFGPLAGGFLSANVSWRWAFGLEVIIVALVVIASFFLLEESIVKKKVKIDIVGSILSAVGLAALVYGILEAREFGWFKEKKTFETFGQTLDFGTISTPFVFMVVGVISLILMVAWLYFIEKKGKEPLFSLNIFKFKDYNFTLLTITIILLPMSGIMFSLPVFWQVVRQYDAFETGLTFLPYSVALLVFAPLMGKLSHSISSKYIIQAGILISAVGLYLMSLHINVNSTWYSMAFSVGVFGTGMALFMSQIQHALLATVAPKFIGEASGLSSAARQLGSALGTAIMGGIFLSGITNHMVTNINNTDLPDEQKEAIVMQIENTDSLEENKDADENNPVTKLMKESANNSIVDANKDVFLIGIGVTLLSFVFSFGIPSKLDQHESAEEMAMIG